MSHQAENDLELAETTELSQVADVVAENKNRTCDSSADHNKSSDSQKVYLNCRQNVPRASRALKPGAVDENGGTALHVAARENDVQLVCDLLPGVDVAARDNDGRSALVTAMISKSWDVVRVLLNSRPDILQVSHFNVPLGGDGKLLLHDIDDDTPDDVIDSLFELGADFTQTNYEGETPLHLSSRLIQWLDEHSSKCSDVFRAVNVQSTTFGVSPLHYAWLIERNDVAKILLKYGADPNIGDEELNTPLHMAQDIGLREEFAHTAPRRNALGEFPPLFMITGSTENGITVDENYRDYAGNTALHFLTRINFFMTRSQLVDLLLRYADSSLIEERNDCGKAAIHGITWGLVAAGELTRLLKIFPQTDGRGRNCWHSMLLCPDELGHENYRSVFVHACLESPGCSREALNGVDALGRTPLHYAAMRETNCDVCRHRGCYLYSTCCLQLFGVDGLRVRDKYGRTPLHYACMNKYEPTDERRNGLPADVRAIFDQQMNEKDKDGFTPIDIRHNVTAVDKFSIESVNLAKPQLNQSSSTTDDYRRDIKSIVQTLCDMKIVASVTDKQKSALSVGVRAAVLSFMERLVAGIGEEDERLKGRLLQVGSSFERTRVDGANEFDFNVVLVNISEHCDVMFPDHDYPPVFVQLTRKQTVDKSLEYAEFFDADGTLITVKLKFAFQHTLVKVLSWQKFWNTEPVLEIIDDSLEVGPPRLKCTRLKLKFMRPVCGKFISDDLSIDIVPAIHIQGWWPEGAREVDDDLKSEGCNLVFGQPYHKYRVPFTSKQYFRMSFARGESLLIKNNPLLRAAYIVAKFVWAVKGTSKDKVSSFVLKIATLWSGENTAPAGTDFTEERLLKQLEIVFAKLCEFAHQDYVPNYFLPSQHFPVFKFEKFLKHSEIFLQQTGMSIAKLMSTDVSKCANKIMFSDIKKALVHCFLYYDAFAE